MAFGQRTLFISGTVSELEADWDSQLTLLGSFVRIRGRFGLSVFFQQNSVRINGRFRLSAFFRRSSVRVNGRFGHSTPFFK